MPGTWPATREGSTSVVHWLLQTAADVATDDEWLSPAERERLAALRCSKRRRDWRLGRWTAKQALVRLIAMTDGCRAPCLSALVIRAGPSGAPGWSVDGRHGWWPISISHSHDRGLCAVGPPGIALGCDLERVEPRSDAFVHDWFTRSEQAAIACAPVDERQLLITLVWSAKESSLKAIGAGLTISTHDVGVSANGPWRGRGWSALFVQHADDREPMHGWWSTDAGDLITIVAAPALGRPVALG